MLWQMSRLMTKPAKWPLRPAKTQISLGIRPVWSESSLSAWRNIESSATHWAHCEDWSDWADAQAADSSPGTQISLWVLSWNGSDLLGHEESYECSAQVGRIWSIYRLWCVWGVLQCLICWCASNWYWGGRRFDPLVQQHSFVEIGHAICSTVILSLPLIQGGGCQDEH